METSLLSMLEFSCMIQENEQVLFESLLKNDFEEAYMSLNEADGNEKSFLEKAKETAKAIFDKIIELLKSFKTKIVEWFQLARKKFGDLIKADSKISAELDKVTVDKLQGWEVPKNIQTGLAFQIFCTGHDKNYMIDYYADIADANVKVKDLLDKYMDEISNFKPDSAFEEDRAKEKITKIKDEYMEKLKDTISIFGDLKQIVDDANDKASSSYRASSDNMEVDLKTVKGILKSENMTDRTKKMLDLLNSTTKSINSSIVSCTAIMKKINQDKGNRDENNKGITSSFLVFQARAYKEMVDYYLNETSKLYHNLMSLYARAYADIRKYALGAINYAAKHSTEDSNIKELKVEPIAASYIYDASDEYVYEALGLAV